MRKPSDKVLRVAARRIYGSDEIEIDDNAKTSRGCDPGTWVAAWVWVYDRDVTKDDRVEAKKS